MVLSAPLVLDNAFYILFSATKTKPSAPLGACVRAIVAARTSIQLRNLSIFDLLPLSLVAFVNCHSSLDVKCFVLYFRTAAQCMLSTISCLPCLSASATPWRNQLFSCSLFRVGKQIKSSASYRQPVYKLRTSKKKNDNLAFHTRSKGDTDD